MAITSFTGTNAAENFSFKTFTQGSKPVTNTLYTLDGGAGIDKFYFADGTVSYLTQFKSTAFKIGTVDANGFISVTGASTGGGTYLFSMKDVETLVFSDKTVTLSYGPTVDITPPTVSTFSPTDGVTGVAANSNIVLTFSEAIAKGTGLIELHSGSAAGPVVESYNAVTSTNLTISGSTLTINPTSNLADGTHYFVTFASGSVKDIAGNSYAGTTTYDFTTDIHPPLTAMIRNSVSVMPTVYSGPATGAGGTPIHFEYLGDSSGEVIIGTAYNDFINVGGGTDAVDAGAGNDVIDGGIGSNFLTGGTGADIFFSDGRSGVTTWSTITDWQAGEQLSVWGWTPGTSTMSWVPNGGAAGYTGLTMHADLNGDGTIDTSVTFTGITSQSQLPAPLEFSGVLWFT